MLKSLSTVTLNNTGRKFVQLLQTVLLCLFASTVLPAQTAGSLDTTFGNNGVVIKDFGDKSDDQIYATAIQPDGKILVGGRIYPGSNSVGFLARYTTTGQLDPSFGNNGFAVLQNRLFDVTSIKSQFDGTIIISERGSRIVRLFPNGQLDNTFGNGGIISTNIRCSTGSGSMMSIQTDGKIVVVGGANGCSNSNPMIARYTATGQPDFSFGTNGEVISTSSGIATTLAIQPSDGKIVVGTNARRILRYTTAGQLDISFDSATALVYSIVFQSTGKIIVGSDSGIRRYTTAGQLDTTFGNGGIAPTGSGLSIALYDTDKIAAGGGGIVTRLLSTGQPDTSFGNSGDASTPGRINSITLQSNGSIIVGGFIFQNNPEPDVFLTRFSSSGHELSCPSGPVIGSSMGPS